jgi:3-oxoadipate enol-lactonase
MRATRAFRRSRGSPRVWWDEQGTGQPVLVIGGLGSTADAWHRVTPRLVPSYRVISFDHRGMGRSPRRIGPSTIRRLVDDAIGVLDSAGETSAHIVGHSLGGMVAQELALQAPRRVRSLTLVATMPGGLRAARSDLQATGLLLIRPWLSPENAIAMSTPFLYASDTPRDRIEEDTAFRLEHPMRRVPYYQQLFSALAYRGSTGRLSRVEAPTLIMHGTADRIVHPANADILANQIRDARLELFPDAGHHLFTDRVDAAEMIKDFLDEVARL